MTSVKILLVMKVFNPFTLDSVKSKTDKCFKITNWVKMKNKQHHSKVTAQQLSNEWSHFMVLSIESKARKLCITQGFTLGVKGLILPKMSSKLET